MIKKLADDFGGDDNILSMIRVANTGSRSRSKVQELKDLETKVLVQYLDRLMTSRKMDDKLETVLKHLGFLNTKITQMNPNFPDAAFLRILTAKYGDRAVAKGLPSAISTGTESTRSVAVKLQMQQLNTWKKEKKSVNDVFKLLNFDQYAGIAVVSSPGMNALHGYIKLFYTEQPALKLYIKMLSSRFNGEDKLALFLQAALNDGTTGPLVGKLKKDLFQKWKNDGLYHDSLITKVFHVKSGPPTPAVSRIAKEYNTFITPSTARETI
ncbi:Avirulence (Avh) protein [Phytophthora megakarya]|uniref:Avirulence (Avh) protein n=1 Tax=Phytophthora megakarya TaxID=4795 RepID=A0A225WLM5_9STRA|nr:Avirulence (Avh) protein [Phytophthora megakarya]